MTTLVRYVGEEWALFKWSIHHLRIKIVHSCVGKKERGGVCVWGREKERRYIILVWNNKRCELRHSSYWLRERPISVSGGTSEWNSLVRVSDLWERFWHTQYAHLSSRSVIRAYLFTCLSFYNIIWETIRVGRSCGMYTAGLNPFYASNFSLWSAYCAGGFAVDTMKKPSFCIADILQAGDGENIPGSSALMVHMGHHHHHHQQQRAQQAHSGGSPLRPAPVAPEPSSVFGARVSPASPYHRHGLQLTTVSRTPFNSQQAPPPSSKDLKFGIDRILSTDFDPKCREKSSLRGEH